MSVERVREYLNQYGLGEKVREFEVSSATVELAAQAAGVIPAKIAKTLSFKIGEDAVLIVAAGDAKIDNRKYKDEFGTKAKMLSPEEVISYTGHVIGGVCPFDIKSAGSASSCVELTLEELEKASKAAGWVDVCKLPDNQ